MSGYKVYCDYVALKQHFTKPSFDYMKYGGKTRAKVDTYEKRKDKFFFEKLGKKQDYHDYMVANLSYNPKVWIRELCSDTCEQRYSEWKKLSQSLSYVFKQDLSKLEEQLEENFRFDDDNQYPKIIRLYLSKDISLETLCIILTITDTLSILDKKLEYDPIWDELRIKILKYTPFIKFDKSKFKKMLVEYFNK